MTAVRAVTGVTAERDRAYGAIARPSGAFSMVAIDQRESLRTMLSAVRPSPVLDRDLIEFKLDVARHLSPHASGLLVDEPYGLAPIVSAGVLDPACGLIVAVDSLVQEPGGIVEATSLDRVAAAAGTTAGAVALKILVLWLPDRARDERQRLVDDFVGLCRSTGLLALVEGVVRPATSGPHGPGDPWLGEDAIVVAAAELCAARPDVYKGEVPTHGRGSPERIEALARDVSSAVDGPWVVLSQGVDPGDFPTSVEATAKGGASGFLAGRAIWSPALRAAQPTDYLAEDAPRVLDELGRIVDTHARTWQQALDARTRA